MTARRPGRVRRRPALIALSARTGGLTALAGPGPWSFRGDPRAVSDARTSGGPMPARSGHLQVTGGIPGGCVSSRKAPPVWDLLPPRPESAFIGAPDLVRMGRRLAWTGARRRILPLIPRFRDGLVPATLRSAIPPPVPACRTATDFVPASGPVIPPHAPVAGLRPGRSRPGRVSGAFRTHAPVSAVTAGLKVGKRCGCAHPVKVPVDTFPPEVPSVECPSAPIPGPMRLRRPRSAPCAVTPVTPKSASRARPPELNGASSARPAPPSAPRGQAVTGRQGCSSAT
jgi:hypothetical protein